MKLILKNLESIFQNYFNDKKIKLKNYTNSKHIKNWDSLAQVGLILAIEKKYRLKFSIKEISQLKNVGEMVSLIEKKIK
jgi:acyl carrier protein